MYKCILVPTDGSEFCERAIRHGVSQPRRHHSRGTVKLAAEKLAFVEQVAKTVGIAVETVRASNDHHPG